MKDEEGPADPAMPSIRGLPAEQVQMPHLEEGQQAERDEEDGHEVILSASLSPNSKPDARNRKGPRKAVGSGVD